MGNKIFILTLILLVTTGCANVAKNNSKNSPIVKNNNTDVETEERKEETKPEEIKLKENQILKSSSNMKLKEWKTYTDEEYGFEFNYPSEWEENGKLSKLNIRKIKYKTSPDKLGPDDHALVLTKNDLEIEKKSIGDDDISLYTGYDVPGGSFYRSLVFFEGYDKIALSITLTDIGLFSWPTDKEKINKLEKDLENRNVDKSVLEVIDDFDKMANSLIRKTR